MPVPLPSRRTFAAAVSLSLAFTSITCATQPAFAQSAAQAAAITYYTDDPAKWGTPLAWQPPAYPKALLDQQVTGKVDVIVNVTPEGRLADVAAIRSTPAQPVFEDAVREALRDWTFTKAMDAACKPAATRGQIQVRFEIADGKPQVNVGAVSADKKPDRAMIQEANRVDVNKALAENYPRDAGRRGRVGEVHASLKVDARSGETKSVDITEVFADNESYNPEQRMQPTSANYRMPPRSAPASIQFATVAREQLAALRFEPVADAAQDVITVCREVDFRLRGLKRN
jgi:TonB family protein